VESCPVECQLHFIYGMYRKRISRVSLVIGNHSAEHLKNSVHFVVVVEKL